MEEKSGGPGTRDWGQAWLSPMSCSNIKMSSKIFLIFLFFWGGESATAPPSGSGTKCIYFYNENPSESEKPFLWRKLEGFVGGIRLGKPLHGLVPPPSPKIFKFEP